MASRQHNPEWELPSLKESIQFSEAKQIEPFPADKVWMDFYGAQFYPYTEPGVDPVFALVGGKHILVCRPPSGKENTRVDITQYVLDEETGKNSKGVVVDEDYYACAWTKDFETGEPLLCVAGLHSTIKIVNALTGKLVRTLYGHGGEINDLVISPTNPYILASASNDLNVRIWSLDPAHAKQPCAAVLEGDGHKEAVMTLTFHASGKFLLSGGVDHIINLWTLPDFPDSNTGTNKPTRIYYPHFSTSEIHEHIVDCVAFYGDLILSKAANENCIVLWSINNFDSKNPAPAPTSAPTTHDAQRETRSVFTSTAAGSKGSARQCTRLLEFQIPDSELMFTRFSLFPGGPNMNPVLAFCNMYSKVFFWDLTRLEVYHDASKNENGADLKDNRPAFLNVFQHRNRGGGLMARVQRGVSPTDSSTSFNTGSSDVQDREKEKTGKVDWDKSMKNWTKKYEMDTPLTNIVAHKEEIVKGFTFAGRYITWSRDGQWCVVVGSSGVFAVLQRWGAR